MAGKYEAAYDSFTTVFERTKREIRTFVIPLLLNLVQRQKTKVEFCQLVLLQLLTAQAAPMNPNKKRTSFEELAVPCFVFFQ
jgi:hypothetical protein